MFNFWKKPNLFKIFRHRSTQGGGEGGGVLSSKQLSHKNAIKHEKGKKSGPPAPPLLDFLTTPSTLPKKNLAKTPRPLPPPVFPILCIYVFRIVSPMYPRIHKLCTKNLGICESKIPWSLWLVGFTNIIKGSCILSSRSNTILKTNCVSYLQNKKNLNKKRYVWLRCKSAVCRLNNDYVVCDAFDANRCRNL